MRNVIDVEFQEPIKRRGALPDSEPDILSNRLIAQEDQVQQAWRRLVYAVKATRDHDAAIAMRRFHDAVGELFGL